MVCTRIFPSALPLSVAALLLAGTVDAAEKLNGFPRMLEATVGVTSPAVGDVDGDRNPDIVLGVGAELRVFTAEGEATLAVPMKGGALAASPTLGDLDGDGTLDIIVGDASGQLHALGGGGSEKPGFPVKLGGGITATALVADLDGDGALEIAVGTKGKQVFVLEADGSRKSPFPVKVGSAVDGCLAFGDVTGDGIAELFAATASGAVYAFGPKGKTLPGWPVKSKYKVSGGPALGDIDDDGINEVVYGSQDFNIYALEGNGRKVNGFPVRAAYRIYGAPALADINGDEVVDIVIVSGDGKIWVLDGKGKMLRGWPQRVGKRGGGGAVIADVDRDGDLEIAVASGDGVLALFHHNGKKLPGFPVRLEGATHATPALADLDRDGGLDVVVGTVDKTLFGFRVSRAGKEQALLAPWPTLGRDTARVNRTYPNPPRYKDVKVVPERPTTGEALSVEYTYFDLDGEPEADTQIRWFSNGKHVPELDGRRTVPAERTGKGQKWSVEVQDAANFKRFGSKRKKRGARLYRSKASAVQNSPPSAPEVSLSPAEPKTADDLKVTVSKPSVDPDGDKIRYSFRWLKGNQPARVSQKTTKIKARMTRRGEVWTVIAVPSDGKDEGPPGRTEVTIGNTPPGPPAVQLLPAKPRVTDKITVKVKARGKDPDGDKVHSEAVWTVAGKPHPAPPRALALEPFAGQKGQVVAARVTAWDDDAAGGSVEARVTLVNSAPRPPTVAITPKQPRTGDRLVGHVAVDGEDDDGDRLRYRFSWLLDGKIVKGLDGPTVPPDRTRKGQKWKVRVVASDGKAEAKPAFAEVQIGNTAPRPPKIAWKQEPHRTESALELREAAAAVDPDGDRVTLEYAWTRDGKAQSGMRGPSVPAGSTRSGQEWRVTVTPTDGAERGEPVSLWTRVRNTVPGAPAVDVAPAEPRTTDKLVCRVKTPSADPDGEKLEYAYAWFRNGDRFQPPVEAKPRPKKKRKRRGRKAAKDDGARPGEIAAQHTRKGEKWTCRITPRDGSGEGKAAEASVTLANTPPTAPKIELRPRKPATTDRLVAVITEPSRDTDGDTVRYRFQWYRGDEPVKARDAGRSDVAPERTRRGETWRVEVIPRDDQQDGAKAEARVTIVNSTPLPPRVVVEPAEPATNQDVKARIRVKASDADGDALTLSYRWLLGGKAKARPADADPAVLTAAETRKNQVWRLEVTAKDEALTSSAALVEFKIENSPPGAPKVAIEPAKPLTTQDLTCKVVTASPDLDRDKLQYGYAWLRDGEPVKGEAKATLLAAKTKKGQRWTCRVTPRDDEVEGAEASAAVAVLNTTPTPPQLAVEPAQPKTGGTLSCKHVKAASDPDRDRLTYRYTWSHDGKAADFGPTMQQLPPFAAKEGEKWRCKVKVLDGEAESEAESAEVVVQNSPPGAPGVAIDPARPDTGTDLRCFIGTPARDPDGDAVSYEYAWSVNKKPAEGLKDPVVPAARTAKKQRWQCQARAIDDQQARGPWGKGEVTVYNAKPGAARLAVSPAQPKAGDELECKIVEPSPDPDGDRVRYDFYWYKDGVKQKLGLGASTVPGSKVRKRDLWRCEVVPKDGIAEGPRSRSADVVVR